MAAPIRATFPSPPTWASVSAGAIEGNTRRLKAVSRARDFMAVVKADGYGHGALTAARAALRGGATWIGVYGIEEAVPLRQGGITAPILAFRPLQPGEGEVFAGGRVLPTIAAIDAVEELSRLSDGE